MKFAFAPEATPLPGYTIKRAIDRGGFGEVYFGLTDSGKEVALKLLQRNQQVELRGVTQCLNLKHPNLVTIFDVKTDADGDHWVVMEYVAGKSLEQVLEEYPRGLPPAEVEQWLAGMAAGTGFLHDRGIVHRDLKPANVFRENGVVKIGDVGLSKFITPSRRSAQTESVGTVYYMAPEVARGKYGSELDVYSLGVMLYEMLTGHVPFNGESTGEILMKHLTEPPDLAAVPAPYREVVGRALEKDPQRRTPGALQLLEDFRRAMAGKPVAVAAPATNFVDVEQVEEFHRQGARSPAGVRPGGTAATAPYPADQNGRAAAAPVSPGRSGPHSVWHRFGQDLQRNPWLAVALVVALAWMFPRFAFGFRMGGVPAVTMPWFILVAAVSYLAYWTVKNYAVPGSAGAAPPDRRGPAVPTASPPVVQPVVRVVPPVVQPAARPPVVPRPQPPKINAYLLNPDTRRAISLGKRLRELTGSLTMAAFWGVVCTAIAAAATVSGFYPVLSEPGQLNVDPGRAGLFGMTTILGSWLVLLPSKFWEGTSPDHSRCRLILTTLGAALGAFTYWLSGELFIQSSYENSFPGLLDHIGPYPLLTSARQSTLAGYVVFFGALFGLRRWWWLADSFRSKRFRIASLVFSGFVGFFIPAAFPFHQAYSIAWALAISTVLQFSSPFVPVKERPPLVQVA